MSIAIYIGAGNDIRPVNLFTNIKKFYYIDSQPFSHSGKDVYLREEDGINGFSNPNFILHNPIVIFLVTKVSPLLGLS